MMLSPLANSETLRSNERGAALITTLLLATLVLAAGGALILSTGMSTTTAIDATAEMQAYYGAEAGLQQALNVLRGNVTPHGVPGGTKITFRNAVTRNTCNQSTDPNSAPLRLSGWLNYDYTSTGSAFPDRVKVTPTDNTYTPLTGIAFSLTIADPDSTPIANGDPTRLVVRAIGYGPKGAMKRLEMVVHRNAINFSLPGAITVVGTSPMTFALGNSNAAGYTGNDSYSPPLAGISAVAVSAANRNQAQLTIDALNLQGGGNAQVTPSTALALDATNTPPFLSSADATRSFLVQARDIAQGEGRYFTTGAAAVAAGLGTSGSPVTTVIDNYGGDPVDLGSGYQGCGLLIVTGNLITSGNTDFEGVILVLGGTFNRNGNGNGHIDGGIIVASLDPRPDATTGFTAPTFSVNGAGNSDVRYNSDAIRRAFDSAGVSVAGIHEY